MENVKKSRTDNSVLLIPLAGVINADNASAVAQTIAEQRAAARDYTALVFDAKDLTYISSAGLRIIMQVIKEEKLRKHAPVSMIEVSRDVYDILDMTGFTTFVDVQKALREISLEGSTVIGEGFFGKVYRLNPETVVKVYANEESIPVIKREQARAKKAFIKGIPTAISYDIVRVGDTYGSVFELLQAKSFNDWVIEYEDCPEKLDELIQLYVSCLKQVHETELDMGDLPFARDEMLEKVAVLQAYLPQDVQQRLQNLLASLPDDLHAVHGDFQMKNVMLCNGEPMLIDMETLCIGQPIFDLQGIYVAYKAFPEDEPDNATKFLGIRPETADYIWRRLLELYFGTEANLREIEEKIKVLAYIRFLQLLVTTDLQNSELGKLRIKHTQEHLQELSANITSLKI
ncbi:MAG: STAS domain-containing protein [Selenomonas ruminantium]|uniref:STAS domain-containing protein n=1 Tax=Selenomonas ruminantium TaxID=971 RepID=A0A927WTP6_SELRU|nr:STAS domain-containing protein [Selenomonas ruminantium]